MQADADRPLARPEFGRGRAILDLQINFEKSPPDEAFRDFERMLVDLAPLSGLHGKSSDLLTMHLNRETRGLACRSGKGLELKP